VKFLVGIFDRPYVQDVDRAERIVNSATNQQVALRAARESMVLLKNERNVLPLSKDLHSIAVIGPNADDDSLTRYRYGPNGVKGITVLEGIRKKLGNKAQINYAKGCEILGDSTAGFAEAVMAARGADLAIVFVGEAKEMEGEAASRSIGMSASR